MACFVDNMFAAYGRMKMCYLIADTEAELHAMADKIGVARRWFQRKQSGDHYDVSIEKRALAVKFGAVEVTWRQCWLMCSNRRKTGELGDPSKAQELWQTLRNEAKGSFVS